MLVKTFKIDTNKNSNLRLILIKTLKLNMDWLCHSHWKGSFVLIYK